MVVVPDPRKPIWASKTVWVNLIALIAAVTGAFGLNINLDPESQAAIIGGIMAIINIALRLVTDTPVRIIEAGHDDEY